MAPCRVKTGHLTWKYVTSSTRRKKGMCACQSGVWWHSRPGLPPSSMSVFSTVRQTSYLGFVSVSALDYWEYIQSEMGSENGVGCCWGRRIIMAWYWSVLGSRVRWLRKEEEKEGGRKAKRRERGVREDERKKQAGDYMKEAKMYSCLPLAATSLTCCRRGS